MKQRGLTVIIWSYQRLRSCWVATKETNRLSIWWQLPFLSCVLIAVLLIAAQLGQDMMNYTRFFAQFWVIFDITSYFLEGADKIMS